jgi:hypothetical protein
VPETIPAALSDRPAGRLPEAAHVAPLPAYPSAVNEYEYGTPTKASGSWLSLFNSAVTLSVAIRSACTPPLVALSVKL